MHRLCTLLLFATFVAHSAFSQQSQHKNDSVASLVMHYLDDKNVDALYDLTGYNFRAHVNKEDFKGFTDKLFSLGKIQQSDFLAYKAGVSAYKITYSSGVLEMVISLNDKDKLEKFGFKPFKEQVADKPAPVPSSNPMRTALDSQVDFNARKYIQKENTVGLCIGILKDGKFSTYGYGATKKDLGALPDENNLFEIGSITKTFTATLLAWYMQEKKVQLTDPITKYLPDSVATNKELQGITLQMLSNHTSGMPSLPDNFLDNVTDPQNPCKNYTRADMFSYLQHCKPEHIPGTNYSYSNFAAGLLGVILERVSGKSYRQMVGEIICDPLHMNSTVIQVDASLKSRFVSVYNDKGDATSAWDFDAIASAGALRSTVHDLLLYAKANLATGGDRLSQAIKLTHQITNTKTMEVGLGWHGDTSKGERFLWHNGGTYGSSSYLAFVPGKDIAVVVLSNCSQNTDAAGKGILALLQ